MQSDIIIIIMDLIKKGQKITLYFTKENSMVEMACIIDTVESDRLVLIPPQYFMRYIDSLKVGTCITAKIFTKMGTIDFNTIIISSPLEDLFEIELDCNSLKLTENAEIPVISAVETLEIKKGNDAYKVKTFEISTEFVKFTTDKNLAIGDTFDFAIILPKDYGIIKFKGNISEIDPIYDNEYTAKYTMITENDRQALLYYMYMYSIDSE